MIVEYFVEDEAGKRYKFSCQYEALKAYSAGCKFFVVVGGSGICATTWGKDHRRYATCATIWGNGLTDEEKERVTYYSDQVGEYMEGLRFGPTKPKIAVATLRNDPNGYPVAVQVKRIGIDNIGRHSRVMGVAATGYEYEWIQCNKLGKSREVSEIVVYTSKAPETTEVFYLGRHTMQTRCHVERVLTIGSVRDEYAVKAMEIAALAQREGVLEFVDVVTERLSNLIEYKEGLEALKYQEPKERDR